MASPLATSGRVCEICHGQLSDNGTCLGCLLRDGLYDNGNGPDPELSHGIFGDFEISRRQDGSLWELGRGAMGITYRAVDNVLKRTVALKVIETRPGTDGARAIRERFLREARVAAGLHHPNVAEVFHFEALPEVERCYYAMELVAGETLEARVRRDGPLDVSVALEIAIQVTSALVAAAEQGLIHRDLKPANIMVSGKDGPPLVKVIDFGLAKAVNKESLEMESTHGGFVGTPTFASPEQFRGIRADARSDIYSLGVTLWYVLTGEVPHPGKSIEEIRRSHDTSELPVNQLVQRKVPPALAALLRRVLSPDPTARPQSANALQAELEDCQTKLTSGSRRRGQLVASALAIVGIAVVAVAVLNYPAAVQKPTPGLISDEKLLDGHAPTANTEAYEEYLRGIAQDSRGNFGVESQDEMLRAFGNAVRLDPAFALAWAHLSIAHSFYFWYHFDYTDARIAQAKHALEMATKLQPELGETYLARGYFHYRCERNYAAAIHDFSEARRRLPNSADALRGLALVERRQGRWNEAAEHFQQAAHLDPLNLPGIELWGVTVECLRRYSEVRNIINRIIAISPDDPHWIIWKARTYQMEGDMGAARKLLGTVIPQISDSGVAWMARSFWFYERDYQKVIESCSDNLRTGNINNGGLFNIETELALAQKWAGEESKARLSFMTAKSILAEELAADPTSVVSAGRLGIVYAELGDRNSAIREGERAVALSVEDPHDNPQRRLILAFIYAQLGDVEMAIKELPELLQMPASGLTPAALKLDPIWDPIRGNPRFQNLLSSAPADEIARGSLVEPGAK